MLILLIDPKDDSFPVLESYRHAKKLISALWRTTGAMSCETAAPIGTSERAIKDPLLDPHASHCYLQRILSYIIMWQAELAALFDNCG
jgi:hypothetical protein